MNRFLPEKSPKPRSAYHNLRQARLAPIAHIATVKTTREPASEGIPWHALPLNTIVSLHLTDPAQGLTDAEAAARRAVLDKDESTRGLLPWLSRFRNFHDLIKATLLLACLTFAFFHQWPNALAALLLFLLLAWWAACDRRRQHLARRFLAGLRRLDARVLRDGVLTIRDASELAPGDVIILLPGDIVPADGRLFVAESLFCREEILHAVPLWAEKSIHPSPTDAPLNIRSGMIYLGTRVVSGLGRAIVVATGRDTALGQLAWPDPTSSPPGHASPSPHLTTQTIPS